MRTSLNGMLCDVAAVMNEHRLNWTSVENVYVSSGWLSVKLKSIELLAEMAKRLKVSRKQIELDRSKAFPDKLTVEYRARGIRWYCVTDAPQAHAELIGIDGEAIAALPSPKRVGLPAPQQKPAALIPTSMFGGDE